jgi:hypothetical protein
MMNGIQIRRFKLLGCWFFDHDWIGEGHGEVWEARYVCLRCGKVKLVNMFEKYWSK